ncbi:MAG: T9SS type A sorting domain-containing protein [Chitinophagales bacterium]|nr:T9SS type A sorting domain-containing protein [Chitinophagales bacterium]
MKSTFTLIFSLFAVISTVTAQSTFSEVYTILQSNCATPYCHSGGNPSADLDFSGSQNDVYQELVNVTPQNSTAAAIGDKLVDPGYPGKSFLIRKLAHDDWDDYYDRFPSEGSQMPQGGGNLASEDIEMIRQWIYHGANQNTTDVDPTVIQDYYNGMGKKKLEKLPLPNSGEGFQVRLGSIFLAPLQEIEIDKKHKLELDDDVEVVKIELSFNEESHHFILYSLGDPANVAEGIQLFDGSEFGNLNDEILAAWQDPNTIELPPTTAYFWEKDIVLDLNYHLINYDPDSILAADVYINVYTQQKGIAQHEMFTQLMPVDAISSFGDIGKSLVIPNDGNVYTFTDEIYSPFAGVFIDPIWHIWMLSSHTHGRGIDYDVYFRNPNGSKGEQLFEGYYNFDYSFNQGFYDWEHPPIRYFEPPFPVVDISVNGLIQEASYINPPTNPDTLRWGFTTKDEMMLIFIQYTKEALAVGIDDIDQNQFDLTIAPNPFSDKTGIRYHLETNSEVKLEVFNLLGEKIEEIVNEKQSPGYYSYDFVSSSASDGIYLIALSVDGNVTTQRVVSIK